MQACHLRTWIVLLGVWPAIAHAANPLYVASNYGLYKSADGGATWKILTIPLSNSLLSGAVSATGLAIDPVNPSKIYFTGFAGASAFFASPDAGQTWSATPIIGFTPLGGPGDNGGDFDTFAVDLAGKVIYLIGSPGQPNFFIYKTTDNGTAWTRLHLPNTSIASAALYPLGAPAYHVVADLTVSGTLYASDGFDFFKSSDFGTTWALISTGFGGPSIAIAGMAVDPRNPLTWYALYDIPPGSVSCPLTNGGLCGLFKSTDGGNTWAGLTIPSGYVNSLSFGATVGTLYATANAPGLGGTLFKSTDGGGTWAPLKNGFQFVGGDRPLVRSNTTDASALYVTDGGGAASLDSSSDGGAHFTHLLFPNNPPGCPTSSCQSVQVRDIAIGAPAVAGPAGFACTNTTPPVITSIDSASAYGGYPYFASGSWLEIKGSNLADSADPRLGAATNPGQWTASDFIGVNAPTVLDGVSVSINGKPAYVWYLSTGQLNVQAPEDSATGNIAITVTNCKATSAAFTFARQALAPGLLAPSNYTAGGTQYMVATFNSDGAYVLNTSTGATFGLNSRPAKPSDLIIAYGIGFGDVSPSILPGVIVQQSNSLTNPVTFSFGSTNATLSYSGLAGSFVGLYEFYITVPPGLANGDYQINVTQNGSKLTQTMYLTVHN